MKHHHQKSAALLSPLLLAAAVAHAQAPPPPKPQTPTAEAPAMPTSGAPQGTTGLFGLKRSDNPRVLTLDEALRLAAGRSYDLRVAQARLKESEAGVQKAWSVLLPNISLGANYTFNYPEITAQLGDPAQFEQQALLFNSIADITEQGAAQATDPLQQAAALQRAEQLRKTARELQSAEIPSFVIQPAHVVDGNLTFAMPLFNGRAFPLLQNAYAGVDLTKMAIDQAKAAVLWGTTRTFYQVAAAKQIAAITREQSESARRQYTLAQQRFEQSMLTGLALERAELEVARAEQQERLATGGERLAKGALASLLGLLEDFDVVDPPPVAPLEDAAVDPARGYLNQQGFEELLVRAWNHRVDLRAQKEALAIADRGRTDAWLRFLPSFNLIAQGRYTTNVQGFINQPFTGAVIVQATLPIFDGGMTIGTIQEANAKVSQEVLRVRQLEETVERELRGTVDDILLKKDAVATAERVAQLAKRTGNNAMDLFAEGAATQTEVSDAQLGAVAAEVELARARYDLETARLGLAYALGELANLVRVADITPAELGTDEEDAARDALERVGGG
jgi:outer membrane protein